MKSSGSNFLIDYSYAFGEAPPNDRVSLVSHLSKSYLLLTLATLNSRLKPKDFIIADTSPQKQEEVLHYFTKTDALYGKYKQIVSNYHKQLLKSHKSEEIVVQIFTREACLFGIEEISNSTSIHTIENFEPDTEYYESALNYILAINYRLQGIQAGRNEAEYFSTMKSFNPYKKSFNQLVSEASSSSLVEIFDLVNSYSLPLNELIAVSEPQILAYRGYCLIEYLLEDSHYNDELEAYFLETYSVSPKQFIIYIWLIYKKGMTEELNTILDKLSSIKIKNKEIEKLLCVRKYPIMKHNIMGGGYFPLEYTFLMEKCFNMLINEFWFDKLKVLYKGKNEKNEFKRFRGKVGNYIEDYLDTILKKAFHNYKYKVLKTFDELKTAKKDVELGDIYLRCGKKILLGEVKSGSIYDKEKFGGSVEALYRDDREKFFKDFGVNKLVEFILELEEDSFKYFDPNFPTGHTYEIYPCLILNDKALQTAYWPAIFNLKFQELIQEEIRNGRINTKKIRIRQLVLISVNDIEILEVPLTKNPMLIWEMLRANFSNKHSIIPFPHTLFKNLPNIEYPEKVHELYNELILEYSPHKL